MKTTAERVAELLGNDGQQWTATDGRGFDELVDAEGAVVIRHEKKYYLYRYVFEDGSAIVVAEGSWDIEGPEPFSWSGEYGPAVICAYCGHVVTDGKPPEVEDDESWEILASEHEYGCEWIETRAHQVNVS